MTKPPIFADIFKYDRKQVENLFLNDVRHWEGKLKNLKWVTTELSTEIKSTMSSSEKYLQTLIEAQDSFPQTEEVLNGDQEEERSKPIPTMR